MSTTVASPMDPTPRLSTTLQLNTNVDTSGAFRQDLVLKSGWLQKRTRKTKGWKRRWFVLRADRLSCYKDQKEYKIHRQIYLADVTAIATLKDAKRPNIFGIFSEARNFYFRAASHEETNAWVDTIRNAAKVGESEEEFYLSSPMSPMQPPMSPLDRRLDSSASEGPNKIGAGRVSTGRVSAGRISSQTLDYSGPELGSEPSLEDVTRMSLSHFDQGFTSGAETVDRRTSLEPSQGVKRNDSGLSLSEQLPRVIWHGYLYCLKSKGGVKQWKKYWVVVKNINIAFYKSEEEYRAIKILPLDNIVDAVEIDALSKSKKHCLQIITEGKAYRFAAPNEDVLANSLGAMKSALTRNKTLTAAASPQPS